MPSTNENSMIETFDRIMSPPPSIFNVRQYPYRDMSREVKIRVPKVAPNKQPELKNLRFKVFIAKLTF